MKTFIATVLLLCAAWAGAAEVVIAVSFDGMGSGYMQAMIDAGRAPNLQRLVKEGASTLDARTDYDFTITLPNHTSMITSRPIQGQNGHSWTSNTDPARNVTLHSNCGTNGGTYVASVFDVVHDHGLRTGAWVTKTKFALFDVSYDAEHGAPDLTGADNGPDKLDVFNYDKRSLAVTGNFVASMSAEPCNFAFVHFAETDSAGHGAGWGSDAYNEALATLDSCLGRILALIDSDPRFKGKTTVIVTADHGGNGRGHSDATVPLNYTVPFIVWGNGVASGDLGVFNAETRVSPGVGRPDFAVSPQPIRNGDVGNLALKLLGLGPIPGSTIGAKQDLRVAPPTP